MSRQLVIDDDLGDLLEKVEARTGLTETAAVRAALEEKLARVDRERRVSERLAELKLILARLAPASDQRGYMTQKEGDAWMYDEHGLPH